MDKGERARMWREIGLTLLLASGLALTGWQSKIVQEFPLTKFKAETTLDQGIREYDDGDYRVAARTIREALDIGLTTRSQARAHKYLAFMYCISGQEGPCRGEFRKALSIDPDLELQPAEQGHPMWAPVFDSVKAGMPRQ